MATILTIVIIVAVVLLGLCTVPVKNEVKGNEIITRFALGNRNSIDVGEAVFSPVPDGLLKNLIRVWGTNAGRFKSGNFRDRKTGDRYHLYLTGKGTKFCFETNGKKYLVDLTEEEAAKLNGQI